METIIIKFLKKNIINNKNRICYIIQQDRSMLSGIKHYKNTILSITQEYHLIENKSSMDIWSYIWSFYCRNENFTLERLYEKVL